MTPSSAAPVKTPKSTPTTLTILEQIHEQAVKPLREKAFREILQTAAQIAERRWRL